MRQLAATLILLWGIVGAPALCAGGVILHACPGDEAPGSEHDDECAADPCTGVFATAPPSAAGMRPERAEKIWLAAGGVAAAAVHPIVLAFRRPASSCTASCWPNLPLPASALPLLA